MARDFDIRLGKQNLTLQLASSTVILCDDAVHAARLAKALHDAGARVIDGADAARSSVGDQLGRHADRERVAAKVGELRLPDDVLDWRPRDLSVLERILTSSLLAVIEGVDPVLFDVTQLAAAPFDVAHMFAHLRRVRAAGTAHVMALIADPALITSAGAHLIVVSGDTVVESGPVEQVLAGPRSETLLRRLESTPIPSPLAMQLRRVQRTSTTPVNYSHTQIITLPTRDSIALAGGDE